MSCTLVTEISGSQCIGDSRLIINDNFRNLESDVCALNTNPIRLTNTNAVRLGWAIQPLPYQSTNSRTLSATIQNSGVTNLMLANESVTDAKIAPNTVTYTRLATLSSAVTEFDAMTPRVAKAWITFNGDPTSPTIYSSYNISSIVRTTGTVPYPLSTAAGSYQINFLTPLESSNYVVVGMSQDLSNGNPNSNGFLIMLEGVELPAKTQDYVRIRTWNSGSGFFQDATDISVIIF